jgi:hypothetical protein
MFVPGVANPNWSQGRFGKDFEKYQFFGPHFDQNIEKSLTFAPNLGLRIFFWAMGRTDMYCVFIGIRIESIRLSGIGWSLD